MLTLIEDCKNRYENNEKPENRRDMDFFEYVKKETEKPFEQIEQWGKESMEFVKNREVSVHPQQIDSTLENLRLVILHSYYIDARLRRYMNLHTSIKYVLEQLLKDMNKLKSEAE
ncbi:hypothetical protein GGQ92_000382 [Gracilibacillus halotolerans]|uniref:DUF1798 family protein n=1 Tax=Gracilibacillus halotolerans TaxID=74386 RepID=A0A841RK92_9BACI|nr:DUF1798 family protein [Gracilibacillus halotolerans]MBB6511615.1 hypothetical protein [Gracilibacillus halotolerans]